MKSIDSNIISKLKEAGYKITSPRLAVLKFLTNAKQPMSAQKIHQKNSQVDLASVYRTLNLFKKVGLVNGEFFNNEKRYCLNDHPHHHIICTKCGHVEEVECRHHFNYLKNFSNIKHQLVLTGVCSKCK